MEAGVAEPERISTGYNEIPLIPDGSVKRSRFRIPVTVEIIAFGIFLSESLSGSVTANFILVKTCEVHFHFNKSICSKMGNKEANTSDIEYIVQPYSAVILTGMSFLSMVLPAIMTLFVGPWSDYNGRKPVLLTTATGYFFKFVLLAVFTQIPDLDPRLGPVVVLPVALTGGINNFITAVYSYISDITKEDNRVFRISILESSLYCASVVGVLGASYIFQICGSKVYIVTFGVCASIVIATTLFTYFFVPESVQSTENGKGFLHVFEVKLFKEMLKVCFKRREGCRRAVIFLVLTAMTLTIAVIVGEGNVLYLFTRLRFGWNVKNFTLWASVSLATNFIGLLLGTLLLIKWLKLPDAVLGFVSYLMKAGTDFYVAFIPSDVPTMMYFSGLISIFGGLCTPASRAILSKSVPKEDLGKVFALAGASEALFPLAFDPLYAFIYNSTLSTVPNAFLLVSGSLFSFCALIFLIVYLIQKFNKTEEKKEEEEGEGEGEGEQEKYADVAIN